MAFERLVATRIDRCYRLAWSILLNDADAADATQDAFVAAWRELPRLRDVSAFDGWLNRIVANAAGWSAGIGSGSANPCSPLSDDESREPARAGEPYARTEYRRRGRPRRDRPRVRPAAAPRAAILALHHVDERPVDEIARTLGIPAGTAKSRLHSARRALERAMEAEA